MKDTIRINYDRLDKAFPEAYFDYAFGCAEPGYDDKPVILADWNHVPDKTFDALERHGFSCEWSDEWTTCTNCGKAVRTSPDSYGWNPSYVIFEDTGELFCLDCVEYDIAEYYESLQNKPRHAVTEPIARRYPPSEYNYTLVEEGFESGLHPHQTADPKAILKGLLNSNPGARYIFVLSDTGQFDVTFEVWQYNEYSD